MKRSQVNNVLGVRPFTILQMASGFWTMYPLEATHATWFRGRMVKAGAHGLLCVLTRPGLPRYLVGDWLDCLYVVVIISGKAGELFVGCCSCLPITMHSIKPGAQMELSEGSSFKRMERGYHEPANMGALGK